MSELKSRDQVNPDKTWDVSSIYSDEAAWQVDFDRVATLSDDLNQLQGQLTTPEALAKSFTIEDALGELIDKVYLYAHMLEDQDTSNGESQARMSKVRGMLAGVQGALAWITPEILQQDLATLEQWAATDTLKDSQRSMQLLIRQKPHVLSAAEETILGHASEVLSTPSQAFGMLTNADLTFDSVTDAEGETHTVSNGSYGSLMQKPDRALRENVYRSLYKGYGSHQNTLATLLAGNVKTHVLNARLRHYDTALDAALFPDNVPASVYHALIEAVNDALPVFHRYLDLRADKLGLDDLNMWDMHVPIVPDFELEVDWSQCREWVLDSLTPLGEHYLSGAAQSFDERWYDIYENKGKRSGAYSTGAYGCKPFMLLNYHGTLNDIFTVAHELGHSMHTWLSQASQPYRYSGYPIFLAEIASTTNEALLLHYLLETQSDPKMRAYLLNHYCDSFRGTLFRQAMFAEFELEIHRRAEQDEPITADALKEYYYVLNEKYHGPKIKSDAMIELEWMRIPHFYYNFYVYKYATGFSAAQVFFQRILEGEATREQYLDFLRSGSSRDPLDTVAAAGVDLASAGTIKQAFGQFGQAIDELGALL